MGRDIKKIIDEIDFHASEWEHVYGATNYAPNLQLAVDLANEVRDVKMSSRSRVVQAVRDAANAWQPGSSVSFEEMVAGYLLEEDGRPDVPREYRLRVIAGADIKVAKKGESFFPFAEARPHKDDLFLSAKAMRDFGHTPIIESRTVQTAYGEWEEDND